MSIEMEIDIPLAESTSDTESYLSWESDLISYSAPEKFELLLDFKPSLTNYYSNIILKTLNLLGPDPPPPLLMIEAPKTCNFPESKSPLNTPNDKLDNNSRFKRKCLFDSFPCKSIKYSSYNNIMLF